MLMKQVELVPAQSYMIDLTFTWVEDSIANGRIRQHFEGLGFNVVTVTGAEGTRQVEAIWEGQAGKFALPGNVVSVVPI